jgi:HlyD family secretion protein
MDMVAQGRAILSATRSFLGGAGPASGNAELVRGFMPDAIELENMPLPIWARSTLYALLGFLGIALIWAALAHMEIVVTGRGKVITTVAPVLIQPFEKLTIKSVNVTPGQLVRKGDVLVTLDPTFSDSDVQDQSAQLSSLDAELARLDSELSGTWLPASNDNPNMALQRQFEEQRRLEYATKLDSMDRAVSRAEAALATNRQAQAGLKDQVKVAGEIEDMRAELLAHDVGSKLNLLTARNERILAINQLTARQSEERELLQQIAGLKSDRENYAAEWLSKTRETYIDTKRKRDQVKEALVKAERRENLVTLTAPSDSIVLDVVRRGAGGVASEGDALMSLVPLDSPIEIEAEIDSRDIGNIRTGDPVRLKFEAFPFQKYGTLDGTVRTISQDTLQAPDRQEKVQIYKARIALTTTRLHNVPDDFHLLPGMIATAEIKVGRRRVISYLLYPVVRALDEGMREP